MSTDSAAAVKVPPAYTLTWTVIQALRELGGSGTITETNEKCIELAGLSEGQQAVPHSRGSRSEVEYRLAWARTMIKAVGLATNSSQAVWTLTEAGYAVTEPELAELRRKRLRELRAARKDKKQQQGEAGVPVDTNDLTDDDGSDEEEEEAAWEQRLLEVLLSMKADAFERLAQRLLREAGFANVQVTGKSGDGGIDGTGFYKLSLVSFPVFFQCKRYQGSVGSSEIRNFRGAMSGRGDRGLVITTGTFTSEAKKEATRDGAPPIDLIDGAALTELLRRYKIGVTFEERVVYDVTIHAEVFASM